MVWLWAGPLFSMKSHLGVANDYFCAACFAFCVQTPVCLHLLSWAVDLAASLQQLAVFFSQMGNLSAHVVEVILLLFQYLGWHGPRLVMQ